MSPQSVSSEDNTIPEKLHHKKKKWVVVTTIFFALLLVLTLGVLFFTRCRVGLFAPQNSFTVQEPSPSLETLSYDLDGVRYVYNKDIISILLLGVQMQTENENLVVGPQADTILLLTLNTKTGKADLLPLPRDIHATLIYPDIQGGIAYLEDGPLCNAYALGGQLVEGLGGQLTQAVISHVCGGIPMHRYLAIDMAAIRTMVDAVGGVPIALTGDFSVIVNKNPGDMYVLDGEQAEQYLRLRSMPHMDGSNASRMVRQREFFFALIDALKQKTKENLLFPLELYNLLLPHMSTDTSVRELAYLATSIVLKGQPELHVLEGEMIDEIFIPDATFLQNYLRDLYYIPAES